MSVPLSYGGDRALSGDTWLALLRRLRRESRGAPAIAILGRLRFPTGRDISGVDPSLKLLADRTIGGAGPTLARLHFNFTLGFNARQEEERSTFYRTVLGDSRNLGPRNTFLLDVARLRASFEKGF